MPSYELIPLGSRFTTTLRSFTQGPGLPFHEALSEEQIQQVAEEHHCQFATGDGCVYTPAVTLWAFLTQALSGCPSCVAAVARVMVLMVSLGRNPPSANTGAYCKARAKLPERFLQQLSYQVGTAVEDQAPAAWRWQDRRVLLVDGCELSLPDTPANQARYPQPNPQRPGLGFPMLRLVVLLTFATAGLVGASYGPHEGKETGETALFRQLLDRLRPGDLVVADRYYCSYWMIALLLGLGVDVAFRLHQRRHYDFRRGQRLGSKDHIVLWVKPERPSWMGQELYAQLPDALRVREVCFAVERRGYRSKEIIVATTLCDGTRYAKGDIADLYHKRWHVELDIRSLKQVLGMDQLSCKTPEMIHRELWAYLLGYNLVRRVMAQAALATNRVPRQLSFAGAAQTLEVFRWLLLGCREEIRPEVQQVVLAAIATHVVGNRPGRCEPRCVKRRPKEYARLMKPRVEARAELLQK
jgi:putative transposase